LKTALAFVSAAAPMGYGRALSRLRWRRALPAAETLALDRKEPALDAFSRADVWFLVREESAVPLWYALAPFPVPGRVLVAAESPEGATTVHTLRELETAPWRFAAGRPLDPADSPALAFRTADFPPRAGESVGAFVDRLLDARAPKDFDPAFATVRFDDPSERERPELELRLPFGARRLLDVGCGSGGAAAAAKSRRSALTAVGIEREPEAARRARGRLDRVIEEEAVTALELLASEGEAFDAFLFADVLEHLEDPRSALEAARALAHPGATLVASVPNAGHLSLVRDLLLGRFDPVPAGLADAGHLRWFTRGSLAEMLVEAGWSVSLIEGVPRGAAPEEEAFLSWACPSAVVREQLRTYQWIAVAVAVGDSELESRSSKFQQVK